MPTDRLSLDPNRIQSEIDPRLFGSFVEQMGRAIYTGLYEPDHPDADEMGFRQDVLRKVRDLGVTLVRYPGGNFVSGYRWEDGIGPVANRPARLDPAWKRCEPNLIGLDEFMDWARKANVDPMLVFNLGNRGAAEAAQLWEYCNHPGGTFWSDLRKMHGHAQPHAVRTWCLGNEMDGPWQIGHKSAEEYARVAADTARTLRMLDPGIELVVCGSSSPRMPRFAEWDRVVLEATYDLVDYISLHDYFDNPDNDLANYLAQPRRTRQHIEQIIATCDHVQAIRKSTKPMMLAFDEWNIWHRHCPELEASQHGGWQVAPAQLEDSYTLADALVAGGTLISFLTYADRLKIGCLAQLINVIAPIMTVENGPSWVQTIYHPIQQVARWARGCVIESHLAGPKQELVDHAAVLDGEGKALTLFLLNRHPQEAATFTLDLAGSASISDEYDHHSLSGADLNAHNSAEKPDQVLPTHVRTQLGTDRQIELPPVSWNVLRFSLLSR